MLENLKLKKKKWRYFSKTNYGMTVSKLLTISGYRECSRYIRKESIWNAMPRTKYKDILQNCHFFNNEEADKDDKSYKLEPLITYLNESFFHLVSNDATKSINDQKKSKVWSSTKQFLVSIYAIKTRYLY